MATTNSISQQLLDLLATRNFHPEMLDRMGRPSDAEDAKTFTFDYVAGSGKNYGTMVIVLDSDNEMKIMYGDNLGRTMEGDDKSEFFDFLQHLNQKATSNRWTHSIVDINQLKHTMQGMAAIQEGLFEGYYGTKKVSYAGEPTQARLQIVHSQPLGEGDARHRYIDRMFIETVDGERFKLGFKSLSGARAMLEHVRQGGKPYDIRGCHITETVNEIAVLSRFNRASANRILEGVTQELVTEAQAYYQSLRENLKHMASGRGYAKYFESWHPATINEQEGVVDNIKTLFIEQSIDSRIEAALPLLAKIQQRGHEMKEADIFESWINRLAEGTWTLPETPEQLDKLKTLMTKELIVGPDATNATEQLYDLVGDDILFDRLHELADQDPRANAWNDTEVMNRLAELGVELPEPVAPGNPAEPQTGATAPVAAAVPPNPVPQQPVAEGDTPAQPAVQVINDFNEVVTEFNNVPKGFRDNLRSSEFDAVQWLADIMKKDPNFDITTIEKIVLRPGVFGPDEHVIDVTEYLDHLDEGDNLATFEDINSLRNLAGLPVTESRLMDSAGETLQHILGRFKHEVKNFEDNGDLNDELYHALYDYYSDNGEMPYGVAKARDGDPYNWISDKLGQELGVNENLIAPMAMPVTTEGASCNMTAEGEYCPEHGLAECGNYGTYEGADDSTMSTLGKLAGAVTPNPKDFVQGFKKTFEDNEIVKNSKKLTDGWKGTLAGSAAGGIAGDMAGQALGPAAGAAIGGAVGGVPGAIAGGAMGALAGGPVGGAIGGLAGGKIGDKLGGPEETDEDSSTGAVVKGAMKAATQGLGDLVSGSGKEVAKNLIHMESNSDSALLARIKTLALLK